MTYRSLCICLILASLALSAAPAAAQTPPAAQPIPQGPPPTKPFLRIDAGMHTAPIRQVAVNKACSLIATGSEDKSVRLWRIASGQPVPVRTLRPPIGPDNDGKVNAVAMPPDGSWLAAGGWNRTGGDHWVYIFKTATGEILTRLGRIPTIERLAVSQDGRFLAAALHDLRGGQGLQVWEKEDQDGARWRVVSQLRKDARIEVKGLAFDSDGALFTVAYDGKLRRYPAGFRSEPHAVVTRSGRQPYAVAVHPAGDILAVGFSDSTAVEIYDARTLTLLSTTPPPGPERANLGAVAWSADGNRLYAGGSYAQNGQFVIREWSDKGRGSARNLEGPSDAVLDLTPCADGIVVAAGDPAFGMIDPSGARRFWRSGVGVDMRGKLRDQFLVSPDGSRVRFTMGDNGVAPVLFDIGAESLGGSPTPPADLAAAKTDGLPLDIEGGTPKLAGKALDLDRFEKVQSYAIAADLSRFVLGTNFYLRAYDRGGRFLWKRQAPGVIWGLNLARKDSLVIAASGDGTVRWYRMEKVGEKAAEQAGEELLALFVVKEDRRWIAWTQGGYFTASAGGENLIGWQVNRSWTAAPDFFPVSRFREQFRRPDVIMRVLAELDEGTAVKFANFSLTEPAKIAMAPTENLRLPDVPPQPDVKSQLPPVVRIISPAGDSPVSGSEVVISYLVRSPSRVKVKRVFAEIAGRPVDGAEDRNVALDDSYVFTGALKVKLPPSGDVRVSVVAETDEAVPRRSVPAEIGLLRVGAPVQPTEVQPRLYAVVVGVGKYDEPSLELGDFPGDDAERIASQLKLQQGPQLAFASVETRLLTHTKATKAEIELGLQWLLDEVKDQEDIALFYFSGHGMSVQGPSTSSSFILPVDYTPSSPVRALNKQTILQYLASIPGRVVVFIDACYAADGVELAKVRGAQRLAAAGLMDEFAEQGIISFASSTGRERSYAKDGASFFTKAVIEGLKGQGRLFPTDTQVLTTGLGRWVEGRVYTLSGGKQNPKMLASPDTKPLPLAVVK